MVFLISVKLKIEKMKVRKFSREIANVQYESHCEARKDSDLGQQNSVDWCYPQRCTGAQQLNVTLFFKHMKRWILCHLYLEDVFSQMKKTELLVTFGFYFM